MSKENEWPNNAVILCSCPLARRIASEITDFLYNHNGHIVDYDQYVDLDLDTPRFFARIEWRLDDFKLSEEEIRDAFQSEVASRFDMDWQLHFTRKPVKLAVTSGVAVGGIGVGSAVATGVASDSAFDWGPSWSCSGSCTFEQATMAAQKIAHKV